MKSSNAKRSAAPRVPARHQLVTLLRALAKHGRPAHANKLLDLSGLDEKVVDAALPQLRAEGVVAVAPGAVLAPGHALPFVIARWPDWAGRRPKAEVKPARLRAAVRRCLGCGQEFRSQHCGHRRCHGCKRALAERACLPGDLA